MSEFDYDIGGDLFSKKKKKDKKSKKKKKKKRSKKGANDTDLLPQRSKNKRESVEDDRSNVPSK